MNGKLFSPRNTGLVLVLGAAACAPSAPPAEAPVAAPVAAPAARPLPAQDVGYVGPDLARRQENPGEWVMPAKNYASTRFSELDRINANNVDDLELAWSFSTGTLRGHEGQPLVIGDVMYLITDFPNIVYALQLTDDAYTIKWKYRPEQNEMAVGVACCDVVNRGVAYKDGKIFFNSLDAHTYALDAETGRVIWKVKQGDPAQGQTITMAPQVVKDKVITGISGGEFGVRGFVTANNIDTGEQLWRAYSTGPDEEVLIGPDFRSPYPTHMGEDLGVTTWEGPGNQWKIGGGTTWGWYSYDPELDLIYYGTGNPGTWNPDQRPGYNKWSMTIFARDPDTGMAKWAYQMTPHDAWDYDGVNENVLVDIPINGQTRKVLIHPDRNGFMYVIDRATGEVLRADIYGPVNWANRIDLQSGLPVENPEKRTGQGENVQNICPSAMGAKDQQPSAYSPQTKLLYSPGNWLCMDYEGMEVSYVAGVPYVGAIVKSYAGPGGHRGMFFAWNPTTGEKVWEVKEPLPVWGGALATAGNVVFYGTMDGWFKAVHAETGELLWKKKLGSGIIGAPIAYTGPDGDQYIAILSGVGGWAGLVVSHDLALDDPTAALGAVGAFEDLPEQVTKGGTLYVFRLDQDEVM